MVNTQEWESLDHVVALLLIVWGDSILFSWNTNCIPTSSVLGFPFLKSWPILLTSSFPFLLTKIPITCRRIFFRRYWYSLSLGSVHFLFLFYFSVVQTRWPPLNCLKFTNSILSAQTCGWTISIKFSFALLYFSTRVSIWFLLIIYIFLLILFTWWDNYLVISFRYWYIISLVLWLYLKYLI